MSLFEVGRLCVKLAGRDAGGKCVIVEQLDNNFVLVDGNVRRKKVNLKHLEPLAEIIKLKSGASTEEVQREFKKLDLPFWEKKSKNVPERQKKAKKKHSTEEGKGNKKKEVKAKKEKTLENEERKTTPSQKPEKKLKKSN